MNADIEGSFNGELIVTDLLALKSTAVIEGSVSVSKLSVEPGATFNASCTMGKGAIVSGEVKAPMNGQANKGERAQVS